MSSLIRKRKPRPSRPVPSGCKPISPLLLAVTPALDSATLAPVPLLLPPILVPERFAVQTKPSPVRAEMLGEVAAGMEADYERLRPGLEANPVNTWRKIHQQENREREIDLVRWSAQVARALQSGQQDGTLPLLLRKIRTRHQITWLVKWAFRYQLEPELAEMLGYDRPYSDDDLAEIFACKFSNRDSNRSIRRMLNAIGITQPQQLQFVLRELKQYFQVPTGEDRKWRRITYLRRRQAVAGIDDFFPTPKAVIQQQMLPNVTLCDGCRILEPSAGYGTIAQVVLEAAAAVGITVHMDVVESNPKLVEILELMGLHVIGRDFLKLKPEPIYDIILANPPFGNDACIEHVYRMERCLKPKGRLVVITPNHWTRDFSQANRLSAVEKRRQAFQEWVRERGHWQDIDRDEFKQSDRPIQIATAMVVLDRR
ncbi:hypothetical protein BST81_26590 [Leptolyngbya sp. 'hensonii']|uniref:class I SAM-dependent methyltransferase n=1 Tax=Leptolyngbya sp. 'hensonii' TaxID=1922337 RepID=UPI00095D894B|nr:methyltransferase [Leptolyngbya sp. 'hensonii']OLP15409.1 hypothetical protein BST81_26590 [Leptolyngbya sp. 'hensonii']